MFISHRINTIEELKFTTLNLGIEIDVRDNLNGELYLSHDPFITGELLDNFLKYYKHRFLILNIKSERIEYKVLELLKKYNINNFFFLDSSFPMIHKMSSEGIKDIAIRLSEFESIETVKNMSHKIDWVWVDCFSKFPLDKITYDLLKTLNYKICIVSPELQSQEDKLTEYKNYMISNNIKPDMICTKNYNIQKWQGIFN
jgi:hypothetical protein